MQKLLSGQRPLWFTFWIGYVLTCFILLNIFQVFAKWYGGRQIYLILFAFLQIYLIAILVAVWKSANAYQGNPIWKIIAKVLVVVNIIGVFNIVFTLLKQMP